jgi:hypothetical protein
MMIYKMLPVVEGEPQIYARIDDDGLCRLTCTAEYPEFQAHIAAGGSLLDAEGVEMTPEQVQALLETLP